MLVAHTADSCSPYNFMEVLWVLKYSHHFRRMGIVMKRIDKRRHRIFTPEQKIKARIRIRAWEARNREKCRAKVKRSRDKRKNEDPIGYSRKTIFSTIKRNYGITRDQFDQLLVDSCGRCDSCGEQFTNTRSSHHIDHNHTTGEVRGLLCSRCNVALGMLQDNPQKIVQLLKYLERYSDGSIQRDSSGRAICQGRNAKQGLLSKSKGSGRGEDRRSVEGMRDCELELFTGSQSRST